MPAKQDAGEPGLIGAFARMLRTRDRVLSVEETEGNGYAVKATGAGRFAEHPAAADSPPEGFVEKLPHEGGDVYVAPMLEAMRAWMRRRKEEAADEGAQTL